MNIRKTISGTGSGNFTGGMPTRPARGLLLGAMFIALFSIVWPGAATAAEQSTYRVALNNAPPYRIVPEAGTGDMKGEIRGIYVDIARTMAKRAGFGLEFVNVPFSRALEMMKNGSADMMLGPNRTPEREEFMIYLDAPLASEPKAFYTLPGKKQVTGHADLAGMRIAVLRKAKYYPEFDDDGSLSRVEVSSYEQAFAMLGLGRVDVVIAPEMLGDYVSVNTGSAAKKNEHSGPGRPSYFTIAKSSPLVAEKSRLEDILSAIVSGPEYGDILSHYR